MLNLLDWISILDIFSYLLYDSTFFYYTFGEIHCQLFFIFLIQVFNLLFPWSLSCSLSLFHKCLSHFRHEMASLSENVTITFIKKYIFSTAFNISTFCNVSVFWFVLVHVFCFWVVTWSSKMLFITQDNFILLVSNFPEAQLSGSKWCNEVLCWLKRQLLHRTM